MLLIAFVFIERSTKSPLIRLGIFRVRSLASANLILLLAIGGLFAFFYFSSLYVQQILGYSPLQAGLAFLPVTAGIAIGAGIAQQLVKRIGVRVTGAIGSLVAAFGLYLFSRAQLDGTYLSDVLPAVIPQSIGMGLFFVPITLIATTNVGADDAGLASGLFNTSQQVGGALGLAVLSTLAADKTANVLGDLGRAPSQARAGGRAARRLPGRVRRRGAARRGRRRAADGARAQAGRRGHQPGGRGGAGRLTMADDGDAIGYKVLRRGTPVRSADGVEVGTVRRVQDNAREHIFDGIVIDTRDGQRFVDAPEVARIFERAVVLDDHRGGGARRCPSRAPRWPSGCATRRPRAG